MKQRRPRPGQLRLALRAQQAEAVDELRVVELERLDALQRSCWDAALEGDVASVDRVLKVIAARVRLLGLDQNTDKPVAGGGQLVSEEWRPEGPLGSDHVDEEPTEICVLKDCLTLR